MLRQSWVSRRECERSGVWHALNEQWIHQTETQMTCWSDRYIRAGEIREGRTDDWTLRRPALTHTHTHVGAQPIDVHKTVPTVHFPTINYFRALKAFLDKNNEDKLKLSDF